MRGRRYRSTSFAASCPRQRSTSSGSVSRSARRRARRSCPSSLPKGSSRRSPTRRRFPFLLRRGKGSPFLRARYPGSRPFPFGARPGRARTMPPWPRRNSSWDMPSGAASSDPAVRKMHVSAGPHKGDVTPRLLLPPHPGYRYSHRDRCSADRPEGEPTRFFGACRIRSPELRCLPAGRRRLTRLRAAPSTGRVRIGGRWSQAKTPTSPAFDALAGVANSGPLAGDSSRNHNAARPPQAVRSRPCPPRHPRNHPVRNHRHLPRCFRRGRGVQ